MSDRIRLNLWSDLKHPFLIKSAAELDELAHRTRRDPAARMVAAMLGDLNARIDQPFADCPPGGICDPPVKFYEMITPISQTAVAAASAWWIQRERKWLDLASRALEKLAGYEFWRAPMHLPLPADLTTAGTGADVALAYDMLFDQLDGGLRSRIQSAILKHCTAFIQPETIDRCWWSWAHDGNWSFVTLGGMGAASLAIHPERPGETLAAIETAAGHLQRSLDHINPAGSWREGHGYAMYGFTNAQIFVDALTRAGDDRLARHPGLAALDDFYLFTMLTPTRQVCFGDNPAEGGGGPLLYRRAAVTRRNDIQHFNDAQAGGQGPGGPMSILWRDPDLDPKPAKFDPPSRAFHDIGWAFLRADWSNPDTLTLATKAGSVAGGHQHWDCGTFLLAAHGVELIGEPGIGHYSRDYHRGKPLIKRTCVHNCVLFDGEEQPPVEFKGGAITQFQSRKTYDMVKMDLTNAYEHKDVKSYQRWFFLLRPDLVVMVDEVCARFGHNQYVGTSLDSRLHTVGKVTPRTYDALIERSGAALMVRPIVPPFTPGLGDSYASLQVGTHEGLASRHSDVNESLKYLSIRTECNGTPTLMITALLAGRDAAEVDAKWKTIGLETHRRRRVELYYAGQTLVLDWGNRRWQVYWHVLEGRLPGVVQATVGGPGM